MRPLRLLLLCGLVAAPLAMRATTRTLQSPARFDIGSSGLDSIFTGDFTADGHPDVLVADWLQGSSGNIRVAPGLGDGTFGPAIVTSVTGFALKGTAHFNADTYPDLYLAGSSGTIAVMLGQAGGTFGAPVEVPSSVPADELVAGDFTGDGKTDLALLSGNYGQLVVFAGNGSGGFPANTSFTVPSSTVTDMAAGDFDHDGRLDVASDGYIAWNTGTSYLVEGTGLGDRLSVGDINGDGITDLISASASTWVYFGKPGRGLTATPVEGVTCWIRAGILVAAMDGDGRADLVVGDGLPGGVSIASHDGTAFRAPRAFAIDQPALAMAAADFDGDGNTDLAGIADPEQASFWTARGMGNRTLDADFAFNLYARIGGQKSYPFISDVNGDSKLDIIAIVSSYPNQIAVLFGTADGTFSVPVFTSLPNNANASFSDAGDLNGDGKIDLVMWEPAGDDAKLSVFFSQANGTFASGPVQLVDQLSGNSTLLLPIADYTGDGKRDLLDQRGLLFPGLGNGAFGAPIATGIHTSAAGTVATGNINGDTLPDLAVRDGNDLRIYLNTGAGTFAEPIEGPWGSGLSLGDLNGDGLADLIAEAIYLGAGNGTFVNGPLQLSVYRALIADFDGDAQMDLGSAAAIYFGTGTGAFDHASQTSAVGLPLSTGDFDGNGLADLWSGMDWITITRTGMAAAPTASSQLELSTPSNPIAFGSFGQLVARPVSGTILARGAVFYSNPPAPPYAMELVGFDGAAKTWFTAPPMDSPVTYAATFTGDSLLLPSTSPTLTVTSKRGNTSTTLSTSRLTYDIGQPVGIGASTHGSSVSPTGSITVKKGTTVIKILAAPSGTVSINDPSIFPLGTHVLTAEYEGDGNYLPSTSSTHTITIRKPTPPMALEMSPSGPYTHNQQVTLTASFPNHADVSGSVTFKCLGQTLGTAVISSAQAVVSGPISWGEGSCSAAYGGSEKYEPSSVLSAYFTSYYGTMSTPPAVNARALGSTLSNVLISPISGATHYDIYQSLDGGPLIHIFTTYSTSYTVGRPAGTKVAAFAAAARNDTGAVTAVGPRDFASFTTFTNDPLVASSTPVNAAHFTELQNAINALRVAGGLATTPFPAAGGVISAAQLTTLRTALTQARSAFGMATPLTDPTITAEETKVRAVHVQELRDAVK